MDVICRLSYGSLYDLKARIKAVVDANPNLVKQLYKLVSIDRMSFVKKFLPF
jgi:hypothetical protein